MGRSRCLLIAGKNFELAEREMGWGGMQTDRFLNVQRGNVDVAHGGVQDSGGNVLISATAGKQAFF
jgi:hypothetical protein